MADGWRFGQVSDVRGLLRLHAQCSASTLQRRFLSALPVMSTKLATDLLRPEGGFSLLAEREGEVVAHLAVAPYPDDLLAEVRPRAGTADVGLIVSDEWQRRGIGSALLRAAVREAPAAGFDSLQLTVHPDNRAVLPMVGSLGLRARVSVRDGYTQITLPLTVGRQPSRTA